MSPPLLTLCPLPCLLPHPGASPPAPRSVRWIAPSAISFAPAKTRRHFLFFFFRSNFQRSPPLRSPGQEALEMLRQQGFTAVGAPGNVGGFRVYFGQRRSFLLKFRSIDPPPVRSTPLNANHHPSPRPDPRPCGPLIPPTPPPLLSSPARNTTQPRSLEQRSQPCARRRLKPC